MRAFKFDYGASLIAIPLSAQAETKYWVDMNFAKDNIEGLRNYIKTKGATNDDGDKYIQYYYEKFNYNYLIIYETKTGALDFWQISTATNTLICIMHILM